MKVTLMLLFGAGWAGWQDEKSRAREIPFSEGMTIPIQAPISKEGEHRTVVVLFPEESIETVVAAWDENDLSLERKREKLFLKLLRPAEGYLDVLGGSGSHYRLYIKPAQEDHADSVLVVKRAFGKEGLRRGTPASLELMRSMRLGRAPEGGGVKKVEKVQPVMLKGQAFEFQLRYVYDTAFYRGIVMVVRNNSERVWRLDPSRYTAEGLVLVGAKEMVLAPGKSTSLYLVFWK